MFIVGACGARCAPLRRIYIPAMCTYFNYFWRFFFAFIFFLDAICRIVPWLWADCVFSSLFFCFFFFFDSRCCVCVCTLHTEIHDKMAKRYMHCLLCMQQAACWARTEHKESSMCSMKRHRSRRCSHCCIVLTELENWKKMRAGVDKMWLVTQ